MSEFLFEEQNADDSSSDGRSSADHFVAEFSVESNLVREAVLLPTLSARLRSRIVNAALDAYCTARRWGQARQAAKFVTSCLIASCMASPIATLEIPEALNLPAKLQQYSATIREIMPDGKPIDLPPTSLWAMTQSSEWKSLRRTVPPKFVASSARPVVMALNGEPFDDPLLRKLRFANDGNAVDAFRAIRDRQRQSLTRLVATN